MGKYDLKGIRQQATTAKENPALSQPAQPPRPAPTSTNGRAPGKRSDPEFTRTTVYMKDSTKLKAVRLLQDLKDERDLSELIESLVSGWVSKHMDA
jgi:hypothetical protein